MKAFHSAQAGMQANLFPEPVQPPQRVPIVADAVCLRGFALPTVEALLAGLETVLARAPLRHMRTPGGRTMGVANSNAGAWGWVSGADGYRYVARDPATGQAWPPIPLAWQALATDAAAVAGFGAFQPDACLINQYAPGVRLSLHQDRDERDFTQPIVSLSLGLPATFLFGGASRRERPRRMSLLHGDVVVWGGAARLAWHGVAPVAPGVHPRLGARRVNLTLRRAF